MQTNQARHNASCFQYDCPTPTPTVGPTPTPGPGALPHTGYFVEMSWVALAGVLMIASGMWIRTHILGRRIDRG